jgi:hypothetical protein
MEVDNITRLNRFGDLRWISSTFPLRFDRFAFKYGNWNNGERLSTIFHRNFGNLKMKFLK